MLERMDAPGYLSRDLVATHPNLTYTIYDEITLFLHREAHLDFQRALEYQQFVFRLAGLLGIFLLARAAGFPDALSLLVAALVNCGVTLPGPAVCTIDTEPVPMAFACGATLLAAGLIARARPLAGGLAGTVALLYEPVIAAPFWIIVVLAFAFDRRCRRILRPILPILLVGVLLLANLAQLQPEVASEQTLFARLSTNVAQVQQFRTPYLWFSLWRREAWLYLALAVLGVWAAARVWPRLNIQMRWLLLGIGLAGIVSVLCSYLLVDRARLAVAAALAPARLLLFTILLTALLCALAAVQAATRSHRWEAFAWFALVATLPLSALIPPRLPDESRPAVMDLARWAEQNTWGGSLFSFPDARRELYPGVFRARSRRALWVDWKSGMLAASSQPFAIEWFQRWQNASSTDPSRPIDYYVFKREHRPPGIRTVYQNSEFCVYDAYDLRH